MTVVFCHDEDDPDSFAWRLAIQEAVIEEDAEWIVDKLTGVQEILDKVIAKLQKNP